MGGSGFMHAENENGYREERRDDGDPEHGPEVAGHRLHEQHGEQGTEECADSIERLAEAEAGSAEMGWCDLADQGISRGTANPLADPVDEAGGEYQPEGIGQREKGLGDGSQAVADGRQQLPPAEEVAQRAGEDLDDHRRGFGDALDEADRSDAGTEGGDHVDRQE